MPLLLVVAANSMYGCGDNIYVIEMYNNNITKCHKVPLPATKNLFFSPTLHFASCHTNP